MSASSQNELPKNFSPADYESRLYQEWLKSGVFQTDAKAPGQAFSIMFPPPNVTGNLHLGHALTFTLQDILIRYRRQRGDNVLWQAGTDHAGIATQLVVERALKSEGTDRGTIGREKFIERIWTWKEQSGGAIIEQLKKLGASADWSRERFTMDEGLSKAVRKVFVQLYREGLIYRDKRLVNWDPEFRTAVSDLEVDNVETAGHLYFINYPLMNGKNRKEEFITVATTRPETMLGDVAIAVHPENEKLRHLIGKMAQVPFIERCIPIIADEYSDPEKGTGAVKITPAHDFNDFEVGRRHNLPFPSILDETGRIFFAEITEEIAHASPENQAFLKILENRKALEARKLLVKELESRGLLVKTEAHVHQVPVSQRGGAVIEPFLTTQWYCDAPKMAEPAIEAVQNGEVCFEPRQWENTYFAWMRELRPWCISRQLWWGHRIPVWYNEEGEIFVAETEDEAQKLAGPDAVLTQDPDVLDTWFSSALWPFSTLGWPEKTDFLKKFYPTSVLVTGFDIIFFWVARMMMMGLHFMKAPPFKKIVIHGLVRDEKGQKMSKSRGNGIDPLDLIQKFGADATRMAICAGAGLGRDIRLGEKLVEDHRSFITKIWNAARLLQTYRVFEAKEFPQLETENLRESVSFWILHELNQAIEEAGQALKNFRFDEYARVLRHFIWETFCDWYLELIKPQLQNGENAEEIRQVSRFVFGAILRFIQPVMPFVSAELWEKLGYGDATAFEKNAWPEKLKLPEEKAEETAEEISWLKELITKIRNIRTGLNIPPAKKGPLIVIARNLNKEADAALDLLDTGQEKYFASQELIEAGRKKMRAALSGIDDATRKKIRAFLNEIRAVLSGRNDAGQEKMVSALGEIDDADREKITSALGELRATLSEMDEADQEKVRTILEPAVELMASAVNQEASGLGQRDASRKRGPGIRNTRHKDRNRKRHASLDKWRPILDRLGRVSEVKTISKTDAIPAQSVQLVLGEYTFFLSLEGLIDFGLEKARLEKEAARLEQEFAKVQKKLTSLPFIMKAHPEVVAETWERARKFIQERFGVRNALKQIQP